MNPEGGELPLLIPDWPVPPNVRAAQTLRGGGVSGAPYDSLNLGGHVGDDPVAVTENRARLRRALALNEAPRWLSQVHGTVVVDAGNAAAGVSADAAWSGRAGVVCAVQTADCLPVLFCDRSGQHVAAAHAGWRGLAGGVLEATVGALCARGVAAGNLMAWLGPAIGPTAFEVGDEVRTAFVDVDPETAAAFVAGAPGKWFADLFQLARRRLAACGVAAIYGGGVCTFSDAERFFSHRRDKISGRQATLIWRVA